SSMAVRDGSAGETSARYVSVIIPPGVRAMPVPGRLDYGPQLGVMRPPAEFLPRLLRRRHQDGRVTRPPRPLLDRHGLARHFLGHADPLADAVAPAGAEVAAEALAGPQGFERQQVGLGEVIDVDVVADTGAVGRGVVGAEDLDGRPPPHGRLDH